MNYQEIANCLTGITTPIFGVSWNPPESQRSIARRVISFLEDRRVLYVPSEVEIPHHAVESILEIRRFLTSELGNIEHDSEIGISLAALRSSCRKFMNKVDGDQREIIRFGSNHGHFASWIFISALGELRGVFGIHLAKIATAYGLDVEDDLASIFPEKSDE